AAPRGAAVVLAMVLAAMVVAPPATVHAAISCSTVYSTLMPCLQYVQQGGSPARGCCTGIQNLLAEANNSPDRRTICGCLKNVANGASGGPYITRAAALPSKCNVALPYKISPSVDCNSYVSTNF
uniref:Non-specific lipid-transfer protein n=1 Tax=Aegilops tauschii subsp. strangulata TaxID=200361 RepID=A0A453FU26_AEGTS